MPTLYESLPALSLSAGCENPGEISSTETATAAPSTHTALFTLAMFILELQAQQDPPPNNDRTRQSLRAFGTP
jgi:hypothetical protein